MRFLNKREDSSILEQDLHYSKSSNRGLIREILKNEQSGFCAYSERYLKNTDSVDIEHFDGRLKGTEADGYLNWYSTLSWLNTHKPKKIDPYLPILHPSSKDLKARIKYDNGSGAYVPVNPTDQEAINLIAYLGFNKYELVEDRNKHISRIKELLILCNEDKAILKQILIADKDYLSFATALEAEFDIQVDLLIEGSYV